MFAYFPYANLFNLIFKKLNRNQSKKKILIEYGYSSMGLGILSQNWLQWVVWTFPPSEHHCLSAYGNRRVPLIQDFFV